MSHGILQALIVIGFMVRPLEGVLKKTEHLERDVGPLL